MTGKRYKDVHSLSRADRMEYETDRAARRAYRVLNAKDYEKYDLEALRQRYRSIDEALGLPERQLKSVVASVDRVSKQLLAELDVPRSHADTAMNRYLNAIVVGSEPSIDCEESGPHPFPKKEIDKLDAWRLEELKKDKRVKNHNKTKSLLETQSLFVVPEIQVESIPGAL